MMSKSRPTGSQGACSFVGKTVEIITFMVSAI